MAFDPGKRAYRCLGRTRGFIESDRQSVWIGPHHVLCLNTSWARETHRRFPLSDIQGITIQGTTLARVLNLFYLALTVSGLGVGILYFLRGGVENETFGTIGFMIAVAALVALAINLALGRTCVCRLYTAVHVEELKPLSRWRRARRFVRHVVPAINQAQGALPEQHAIRLAQQPGAALLGAHAQFPDERPVASPRGEWHRIVSNALVIAGALALPNLILFSSAKAAVDIFGFGAATFVGLVVCIRQARTTLPRSLRLFPWFAVLLGGISTLTALYAMAFEQTQPFVQDSSMPFTDVHRMVSVIAGFVMLVMGAVGWMEAAHVRRKTALSRSGNTPNPTTVENL